MRITDVETIILRVPDVGEVCDGTQDAFVILIHTDEGLTGIGEADSMPSVLDAVFAAPLSNSIGRGLRQLLIGQDPLQIEPLWQRMMEGTLYLGTSGVRLSAISGAEMALWDIAGKAYGRPVHELLGGAFHHRMRAYASVLFPDDPRETDRVRDTATRLRQVGFTAMKFGWGGFGRELRGDVALVRAAREGAGDDVDLLIDVGLCWDLPTALERVQALAEFGLYWLEAPLPHEPVSAYAALCARSPIRIACESAGGYWESLRLLRDGRIHVVLPDVSNVGGIGQWKRVALAAATEGAWCVPHCFSTGILSAASLHLLANQPTPHLLEWSMEGSPLNTSLVSPPLTLIDGHVTVPTRPGLGIDLDWSVLERYRVG
jgi:L-alanine-DL-glutamate epimerase-like enolase superfamily enzyme